MYLDKGSVHWREGQGMRMYRVVYTERECTVWGSVDWGGTFFSIESSYFDVDSILPLETILL